MRRLFAALLLVLFSGEAFATEPTMSDRFGPGEQWYQEKPLKKRVRVEQTHQRVARNARTAVQRVAGQILPHPAGCPRRLFCGCGTSVRVFGKPVRNLYLAANWRKYPSAQAAPGMVAWRYGHVFYIEKVISPGVVLAYDPNSGKGLTRLHARSLAGYRVVDPRAS